ncbi:DsrE family protein [Thioalkalivibrio sp. ALE19]|uniref:DsrE family protein n=1 Tax=Thioalkalivibrio sp. ALE19 TaxID=1266909 RepID=UPI00048F4D63|nr:DsrE family protein [Thioalkalivibrio sp. ALE19]
MLPATLVLRDHPDNPDSPSASALRLGGALLASNRELRVFLLDRGVGLARGTGDSFELLNELMEAGAEVRACGFSLDRHQIPESDLPGGITRSSMKALAQWCEDAQVFLF